jgi:hypothetical protein
MKSSQAQAPRRTFHLTDAKLRAIKHLANFFCLSAKDLCLLAYGKFDPTTRAMVNRTVRLLEDEGYVDWRKLASHIRRSGNEPLIYGLTKKGVELAEEESLTGPATKIFKPNSDNLLPHEYEITQFHLALHFLCEKHGWKLYWQQSDLKCGVNPDAMFRITKENGERFYFFLEIEKTKPGGWKNGESKIMRNIGKYYAYYDTDKCEKEWADFRKFRVIITLRNDERRENLLEEIATRYKNRMFWLTTEPAYKQDIGAEIFLTPKDYPQRSYSFLTL